MGPVSERARLGHRAPGLQRRRRRLGVLSPDHARSRAYRWSEDGLGGICDDQQLLCVAFALWNGPVLRRRRFFTGGEIFWLRPDGEQTTADDWNTPFARALGASPADQRFLLLVSGWWEPLTFRLPGALRQRRLSVAVETTPQSGPARVGPAEEITVGGKALMLLERT